MKPRIHKLALGICNCYLIQEESILLVDAGPPRKEKIFLRKLKELSINPKDISLIFITHGHWDHIGSVSAIKRLTESRIAINSRERNCVESSYNPPVHGVSLLGKVSAALISILEPFMKLSSTSVSLVLEDEYSLEAEGISGSLLYTPGHTAGSMSLLLQSGDAFVGDLLMNGFPLRIGPGLPIYAVDLQDVKTSLRLLLDRGAKKIYPSHGDAFEAKILEKFLDNP
jgi:hydroxyacylglutathione hydrolase